MSGLLALLDDVAAIAKVAAASVDDIVGAAAKAGAKAAGVVIDDAAVTPKYVHGFSADRELPIIWRIAWVNPTARSYSRFPSSSSK
jgi:predicted DNA repair protein MutK